MNSNSLNTELIQTLFLATRILTNENVIDGFGHISARNSSNPERFFMLRDNAAKTLNSTASIEIDLNGLVVSEGERGSIERFIHSEIYRARPKIAAIVHTHSPSLIPFGCAQTPLKPLYHMCGFLGEGAPVFDIEDEHGSTNMLITDSARGASLAQALDESSVVLMRGHGATVVGSTIQEAVFRAIYTTINAQLQPIAMQLGNPKFLSFKESLEADELHNDVILRPWEYWKSKL